MIKNLLSKINKKNLISEGSFGKVYKIKNENKFYALKVVNVPKKDVDKYRLINEIFFITKFKK